MIKQSLPRFTILCTTYTQGGEPPDRFSQAATYFYPYDQAVVNTVNEIKTELKTLGVGLLIIDPLVGSIEGRVYLRLFNELIRSYRTRSELVFTSSDAKHRIYALPQQ